MYLFISFLTEESKGIDEFHVELDLDALLHALLGYTHGFLQTLHHTLTFLVLHIHTQIHTHASKCYIYRFTEYACINDEETSAHVTP